MTGRLFVRDGLYLQPTKSIQSDLIPGTWLRIQLIPESLRLLQKRGATRKHRRVVGYIPQLVFYENDLVLCGIQAQSRNIAIMRTLRMAYEFPILTRR